MAYSVPPELTRQVVEVRLPVGATTLEVHAAGGRIIARHQLAPAGSPPAWDPPTSRPPNNWRPAATSAQPVTWSWLARHHRRAWPSWTRPGWLPGGHPDLAARYDLGTGATP